MKFDYPETKKVEVTDVLHGVEIKDNYRWLEDSKDPEVLEWDKAQNEFTESFLSEISFRDKLKDRLLGFMKIDEMSIPHKVLDGERIFQSKKNADEEKWVLYTQKDENSPLEVLIDPNKWPEDETLSYYRSSRDGKLLAYGVSKGGNEAPVLKVMEIESGQILSDEVKGWKQNVYDWDPDGKGFYYVALPLKGEVPEGEEYYWQSVYYHKLGTDRSEDVKLYYDTEVKENWYSAYYSEDGKYLIVGKGKFYKNCVYFKKKDDDELTVLEDSFDAEYSAEFYKDKIYISTNNDAPNRKIYVTGVENCGKSNWKLIVPEKEYNLEGFRIINGLLFVTYLKNACSLIQIYDLDGNYLKDVCLPDVGSAAVWGRQKDSDIWLWFSSFTLPSGIFKYDAVEGKAKQYFMPNLDFRFFDYETEQVWYESKDRTKVSMFLIKKKDSKPDKDTPCFMYAYGGFNISITPAFSSSYAVWLESGGIVAVPNLRGGGRVRRGMA